MSKKFLTSLNLLGKATDPATGTAGDLYYNTTLQTVKVYNGTAWTVISGGGGSANIAVSDTAPASGSLGELWFDSTVGNLYLRYNNAWIQIGGGGGGGGSSANYLVKTANYTASAGDWIFADTKTVGSFTVTLPGSSLTVGDTVTIVDSKNNFYAKSLTVYSTAKIESKNDTLVLNVQGATVVLQYVDSNYGWRIT